MTISMSTETHEIRFVLTDRGHEVHVSRKEVDGELHEFSFARFPSEQSFVDWINSLKIEDQDLKGRAFDLHMDLQRDFSIAS